MWNLRERFGTRFLFVLILTEWLLKGFSLRGHDLTFGYVLRDYHPTASSADIYRGVVNVAWMMKPAIGLLSDFNPIQGYRKRYYMVGFLFIGIAAWTWLSFHVTSLTSTLILVSAGLIGITSCDIFTQAMLSEKIVKYPELGPSAMVFVFSGVSVGQFIAAIVSPSLVSQSSRLPYFLGAITFLITVPFIFFNFLGETRSHARSVVQELLYLCILTTFSTGLVTASGLFYASDQILLHQHVILGAVILLLNIIFVPFILRPELSKIFVFFLLQTSLALQLESAIYYFYTDTKEEFPGGPNLSLLFYTEILGSVAAVFSLLGYLLYSSFSSEGKYRDIIILTNVVFSFVSLTNVIIFSRVNLSFGISDRLFILPTVACQSIVNGFFIIPGFLLLAASCPRGIEASMFAFLASSHNMGITFSQIFGSALVEMFQVRPKASVGEAKEFNNLWICGLIQSILPLITCVLVPLLIPDAKQTERLSHFDCDDLSKNSWFDKLKAKTSLQKDKV